jgi:hypothetical protein
VLTTILEGTLFEIFRSYWQHKKQEGGFLLANYQLGAFMCLHCIIFDSRDVLAGVGWRIVFNTTLFYSNMMTGGA